MTVRARCAIAATAALACGVVAFAQASPAPLRLPARVVVHCEQAVEIDPEPAPAANERVLFDRVAVANEGAVAKPLRGRGPLPYGTKSGLLVRHGTTPVDLIVPRAWRTRVAIGWGAGSASAVRIQGCKWTPPEWWAYAGGFSLRRPACVPLVVRVDGKSTVVRFAIGHAC